jgi:hypothetical protein
MEKVTVTEIIARDYYGDNCLTDTCYPDGRPNGKGRKPQGEVFIYDMKDGKKELVHKSNLVVYSGREMLAMRLVNFPNTDPGAPVATKDEFLAWLGLGEGGVRPADPLDPVPPANQDTDLSSHIMIQNITPVKYADLHTAGVGYPKTGYYKKVFDKIEFERDNYNDDRWLSLKITTTININDANGEQFSEAGLFSAESRADGHTGNFTLFARVTFPSIIKTSDRRLVFVWYLYL